MSASKKPIPVSRPFPGFSPDLKEKPFSPYMEKLLVTAGAPTLKFAPGETVFEEGDPGDAAFFIREGSIDIVSRGRDGTERVLNHLARGELFGEMALLDRTSRSASALAREGAVLFVIPRDEVDTLLRQAPEMALWLLKLSTHRLRVLTRLVAEMEQAHEVNLKILAGQEQERRRIGRDIHDGVAQSFADCIIRLQLADQLLGGDVEKARSELIDLQDVLREGLERIRELIYNLYPKELSRAGLIGAIERFIDRLSETAGMEISFEHQGLERELPAALETTVFCIAQEALNNARKHAQASRVGLSLRCEGQRLRIVIRDDGCGFDVASLMARLADQNHYGLLSMDERAKLAGGSMELESSAGAGTILRFYFPVDTCSRS
jgi:signal transduction histidine kinase